MTEKKKTNLEWVKEKLRDFVERHEQDREFAPLVLDSLKSIGNLIVRSEPGKGAQKEAAPEGFEAHDPEKE